MKEFVVVDPLAPGSCSSHVIDVNMLLKHRFVKSGPSSREIAHKLIHSGNYVAESIEELPSRV